LLLSVLVDIGNAGFCLVSAKWLWTMYDNHKPLCSHITRNNYRGTPNVYQRMNWPITAHGFVSTCARSVCSGITHFKCSRIGVWSATNNRPDEPICVGNAASIKSTPAVPFVAENIEEVSTVNFVGNARSTCGRYPYPCGISAVKIGRGWYGIVATAPATRSAIPMIAVTDRFSRVFVFCFRYEIVKAFLRI